MTAINQRLFLLSWLRKMGLDIAGLNTVFQSIVVSKVLYVLPALFGFYSNLISIVLTVYFARHFVGVLLINVTMFRILLILRMTDFFLASLPIQSTVLPNSFRSYAPLCMTSVHEATLTYYPKWNMIFSNHVTLTEFYLKCGSCYIIFCAVIVLVGSL